MHTDSLTSIPSGIPGSARISTSTESPGLGSWARKVSDLNWPTRKRTSLYARRLPVESTMSRHVTPPVFTNGVSSPSGSVTNTGGAAMRTRQQCMSEETSPFEWSRCHLKMSSPLGSRSPTHLLCSTRDPSYADAQITWSMLTSFSRQLTSRTLSWASHSARSVMPFRLGSTLGKNTTSTCAAPAVYATPAVYAEFTVLYLASPDLTSGAIVGWPTLGPVCDA
mmetsp:Transcript_6639/g.15953  ORF Transcript_6639/g.15953 Transcript_6639/m.15953 type:complete len:223 (-) Transcript_6639:2602-3270(-)